MQGWIEQDSTAAWLSHRDTGPQGRLQLVRQASYNYYYERLRVGGRSVVIGSLWMLVHIAVDEVFDGLGLYENHVVPACQVGWLNRWLPELS